MVFVRKKYDPLVFKSYMDELDSSFREKQIPIRMRSFAAMAEWSKDFDAISVSSPIANLINLYFEERYGERLKTDFSLGTAIVCLLGDPYQVHFPLVYGHYRINPYDLVQDITPAMLSSISADERRVAAEIIIGFHTDFITMAHMPSQCLADINIASSCIMMPSPQHGMSRWHSQQAVEKSLKYYLVKNGGDPKAGHDIIKLAGRATECGLDALPQELLMPLSCNMSIYRYEEQPSSLADAIYAHHASIRLCGGIAHTLNQTRFTKSDT